MRSGAAPGASPVWRAAAGCGVAFYLLKKIPDFIHRFAEMVGEEGMPIVFDNPQLAIGQVVVQPPGGGGGDDPILGTVQQQDGYSNVRNLGSNIRIPQVFQSPNQ